MRPYIKFTNAREQPISMQAGGIYLKLTDDKTVIIEILSPLSVSAISDSQIVVREKRLSPSGAARNWACFLVSTLT